MDGSQIARVVTWECFEAIQSEVQSEVQTEVISTDSVHNGHMRKAIRSLMRRPSQESCYSVTGHLLAGSKLDRSLFQTPKFGVNRRIKDCFDFLLDAENRLRLRSSKLDL